MDCLLPITVILELTAMAVASAFESLLLVPSIHAEKVEWVRLKLNEYNRYEPIRLVDEEARLTPVIPVLAFFLTLP